MKRWLKAELHTHTREDPSDGDRVVFHSPWQLIDAAASQHFEVLAITNHNQQLFSPELEVYARQRGIVLIPGVEATLRGKHVLLYNFLEYRPGWDQPEIVRANKRENQLVVAPHPFFPTPTALRKQFFEWIDLFDALEYSHFYVRHINFNRRAQTAAREYKLPLVGNADLHQLNQLGRTFSRIYAEKNTTSVIDAVKRGAVRVVTQPETTLFFLSWLAVNTTNRSRCALRGLLSPSYDRHPKVPPPPF